MYLVCLWCLVTRHWPRAFTNSWEGCCHQRSFLGHWPLVRRYTGVAVTTPPHPTHLLTFTLLEVKPSPVVAGPRLFRTPGTKTAPVMPIQPRVTLFINVLLRPVERVFIMTLSHSDVPRVFVCVCVLTATNIAGWENHCNALLVWASVREGRA